MGDNEKIRSELKGTTLRVYWAILRRGADGVGPREIMRDLGLSSPSVAVYHLEKLRGLGLAEKTEDGGYRAKEEVKVDVFSDYVRVIGLMLPRYLFYSVFFTTILLSYVFLYSITVTPQTVIFLIFGVAACVVFWVETIRAWSRRPF
jgi:DNA-binding transcriptional ArsR family regulator